ncbi:DUF7528 family protein [Halorientalis halophila]|uniref:DUF7528 family protein n=1 Tax=Halorientalis halophila TaxID=3108499 RepID=UPI003AB43D9D
MGVTAVGDRIRVDVGGETVALTREQATELRGAIDDALTERREFLHTAGEYRDDGAYVVSRRSADSAGNSKVFDSFDQVRRLYERLPSEFTADAVSRTGITGSRRHMLVRHYAEHPAFDCAIARRSPLTVSKRTGDGDEATAD